VHIPAAAPPKTDNGPDLLGDFDAVAPAPAANNGFGAFEGTPQPQAAATAAQQNNFGDFGDFGNGGGQAAAPQPDKKDNIMAMFGGGGGGAMGAMQMGMQERGALPGHSETLPVGHSEPGGTSRCMRAPTLALCRSPWTLSSAATLALNSSFRPLP